MRPRGSIRSRCARDGASSRRGLGLAGLAGCEEDVLAPRPASGFFEPEQVDLGEVAVGRTARASATFRNTSGGELFVRSVRFEPRGDAFAAFLADGGTLNGALLSPGRAVGVEIRFGPSSAGDYATIMTVVTDDLVIELPVRGRAREERPATPSVEPSAVGFSGVPPGGVAVRAVTVRNVGDRAGAVARAGVSGPPFRARGPLGGRRFRCPDGSSRGPSCSSRCVTDRLCPGSATRGRPSWSSIRGRAPRSGSRGARRRGPRCCVRPRRWTSARCRAAGRRPEP